MRKAIIRLRQNTDITFSEIRKNFVTAWQTSEYQGEIFKFESPRALFSLLSPKRWEILEYLQTMGATSLTQLANAIGNANLQQEVDVLQESELLEITSDGKLYVPFVEIHADFTLRQAA